MSEEELIKDIPIKKDNEGNLYFKANEIENIINEKEQEIEILENKLKMIKINIDKLTKEQIIEVIDNYTGIFGIKDSDKE